MTFLKIIVSIGIAIVLLVLLNNIFAKVFPHSPNDAYSGGNDAYSKCQDLSPYNKTNPSPVGSVDKAVQDKYDDCIKSAQQKTNDQVALDNLYAWIKGLTVLLILVVIAVLLFKKYPFYSSALIGCGLMFLLSYPTFSRYGGINFLAGSGADMSEAVKNQVEMFKLMSGAIGFLALTAADIFFFETHKEQHSSNNQLT